MFDHLVKSIIMYGTKIWSWKEYETIEKYQDKFIKWSLRLNYRYNTYCIYAYGKRYRNPEANA